MEDFYRLFQLFTDRRHYRREDLHDARRTLAGPAIYGADSTSDATHRRSRYRFVSHSTASTDVDSPRRCVGLLCDLLWSDPDKEITGWSENDRGVSFTFGPDVVSRFLQKHDMDLICRAHQVVEDGYEFFAKRQLVTLFSAPYVASLLPCLLLLVVHSFRLLIAYDVLRRPQSTLNHC